jgi:hypothetical protein
MFGFSIPQIFTTRPRMIRVTEESDRDRMNTVFVNADAISYVRDEPPDARASIFLKDGTRLDVLESANTIVRAINAPEAN